MGDQGASPIHRRRYVVAALGDSLTDTRSHGGGYLNYVAKRCPESRIDNFGKGGDMVNQIRRRFEAEVLVRPSSSYTHLILFGGVNDLYSDLTALRTVDKIAADLGSMYEGARARGMRVVAVTVAPWGGFKRYFNQSRGEATLRLNHWIEAQREAGMVDFVIDAYALLSCDGSQRLCDVYERRIPDGLHFNQAGHEKLGAALYEAVFRDCR
jgi:lysophospholipase L1-like esterase